jgi:hypothetical protein
MSKDIYLYSPLGELYFIYFTLLYFTLLYFTLLYFTLPYLTLLYFTLLYFTLLLLYFKLFFFKNIKYNPFHISLSELPEIVETFSAMQSCRSLCQTIKASKAPIILLQSYHYKSVP